MTAKEIDTNDAAYAFLVQFYLSELSDPYLWIGEEAKIETDPRAYFAPHMAAWLEWEPHKDKIIKAIHAKART
jgi:hypothetical protein